MGPAAASAAGVSGPLEFRLIARGDFASLAVDPAGAFSHGGPAFPCHCILVAGACGGFDERADLGLGGGNCPARRPRAKNPSSQKSLGKPPTRRAGAAGPVPPRVLCRIPGGCPPP